MRRSFLVCCAVIAALAWSIAAGDPAPGAVGPVLMVGDSLTVGTAPYLKGELSGARLKSDGRVGRPSSEAVGVLRSLYGGGEGVVIFDAGTNDDPGQPSRLANDLASARSITGSTCLIVATVSRPPYRGVSVDGLNRAVRSFASSQPNVQLVDWRSVAVSRRDLIGSDGVHPTPAGYAYRGKLFAGAVRSCGGGGGGGTGGGSGGLPPGGTPPPTLDVPPAGPAPGGGGRPPRPRPQRRRPKPRPAPTRPPPALGDADAIFSNEPVTFASKGARLSGELLLPAAAGKHPAVVMIHDSGPATRAAFRDQAEFLAQSGVGALIYDKRGTGHSTGNPDYRYGELADDVEAGIALLKSRSEVDPAGIGLWALGEGSYVAPLVAARDSSVKAILAASPSGLPPASQDEWALRSTLQATGADAGTHPVATYYRVAAAAGDGPLGSRRSADLAFDPAPLWRRVAQPVLAAWGTSDPVVPPRASAVALGKALADGPNRDRTFATFAGAGHTLGVPSEGQALGSAPGFAELSADWLKSRLGSHPPEPAVRTPLPPAVKTAPVSTVEPGPLDHWPVQLVWLALPALALVLLGALAIRRRGGVAALEGAVDAPLRPWILPAAVLTLDVAALTALTIAVASIVEDDGRGVDALAGVPVVILVAWTIALGALAATVALGRSAWRARRRGEPRPLGLGITLASAAWLLLVAYWLL